MVAQRHGRRLQPPPDNHDIENRVARLEATVAALTEDRRWLVSVMAKMAVDAEKDRSS